MRGEPPIAAPQRDGRASPPLIRPSATFSQGRSCPQSGLMRGKLPIAVPQRVGRANSPLIRPSATFSQGRRLFNIASHVFALRSRDLHKNNGPGRRRGRRKGYELYVLPGHIDWPAGEDPVQLHRQLRGNDGRCHPTPQAAALPPEHPSAEILGKDGCFSAADE